MLRAGFRTGLVLGVLWWPGIVLSAQLPEASSQRLVESGHVDVDGHSVPYRIRRLPVSSFPDLPANIADDLNQRDCLIPQTYAAHHPENVVHASLERAGSSDWAVLCSARGKVSLLVFFGSGSSAPTVLLSSPATDRLQTHDATGVLGFNWAIDPASPQAVRQAQRDIEPRPPQLDHEALADSVVEHRTVYRIYFKGAWSLVATPE
jgi:hypothetical protein